MEREYVGVYGTSLVWSRFNVYVDYKARYRERTIVDRDGWGEWVEWRCLWGGCGQVWGGTPRGSE